MLDLKCPLAIFDLEATGVNLAKDRVVEISILKIFPDQRQEWKTMRINPTIPIPKEVSEIHGIYDDDVKDAPTFKDAASELAKFFEDCDLGGYNSNKFDIPLLKEEFLRAEIEFDTSKRQFVDVFRIFLKMEPRDLTSAYKFYCGKDLENAHSASADVGATYEILLGQLERYGDKLENNMDFLNRFTSDGNKFVDTGRRLVNDNGVVKFNFGKYKGQAVAKVLVQSPQYYDWIMKNDFLLDTKQKLTNIYLQTKFKVKK